MQNLFLNYIRQNRLCEPHHKLLLTVSGGLDSMVMLHLFAASDFSVSVAHCHFQLRGREADHDQQFVLDRCRQREIPFYTKRFDTNNYAIEHQLSIQMAARQLRYAWFDELVESEGFDFIVTAHHLNDSVETVFLNLIHGRGLDGMTGIPLRNNKIIRPLLFATREEIEKYATGNSIAWREDSSNQSDDYKRNFIRHQIIPKLKQLNEKLEQSMERSIGKNKGALELEKLGIEAFASQYITERPNRVSIPKTAFNSFQYPGAVLYEIIKPYGFSLEQCEQVIAGRDGQPGKFFLSASYRLGIDRDELIITPVEETRKEILIERGQQEASLGHMTLRMEEHHPALGITSDPGVVCIDAARLSFPIVWRFWREGDFFYPLGMTHKKKISDFLIDRKVALNDKAGVSVLESNGEIFWVVGHRISDHFKITPQTSQALRFTLRSSFV